MRIEVLNGLSRVTPTKGGVHMQGLSRVNYQLDGYSLNAYTLNGYTLNGATIDDVESYCLDCQRQGTSPTLNGFLGLGKKAREARRERKLSRQMRKQARKDKAQAERLERRSRRGEMFRETFQSAADIGKRLLEKKLEPSIPMDEIIVDDEGGVVTKGLFGPPKLFKDPMGWFSSGRVPTIQKVGVGAGAVLILDQVLNKGKLLGKLTGKKKGAKR